MAIFIPVKSGYSEHPRVIQMAQKERSEKSHVNAAGHEGGALLICPDADFEAPGVCESRLGSPLPAAQPQSPPTRKHPGVLTNTRRPPCPAAALGIARVGEDAQRPPKETPLQTGDPATPRRRRALSDSPDLGSSPAGAPSSVCDFRQGLEPLCLSFPFPQVRELVCHHPGDGPPLHIEHGHRVTQQSWPVEICCTRATLTSWSVSSDMVATTPGQGAQTQDSVTCCSPPPTSTTLSSREGLGFHTAQPRPINSSWPLTGQPSPAPRRK